MAMGEIIEVKFLGAFEYFLWFIHFPFFVAVVLARDTKLYDSDSSRNTMLLGDQSLDLIS